MNAQQFANPPMDYRPVPFWSWNARLDPAEIRRQVRELVRAGCGGGFMHARSGLATEYLGEEWFAACTAAVEEGRPLGFQPWLYDEDRWPSGHAGGRTASKHPDYRSRLVVMEYRGKVFGRCRQGVDRPDSEHEKRLLGTYRVTEQPDGACVYTAAPAEASGADIARIYELILAPCGWYDGDCYPDLMHPDAMREFLNITYEAYYARYGKDFGKLIPGVFTDEPLVRPYTPWSVRLAREFRARRGYDLIPSLPALYLKTSDAFTVRHDYWKTVAELYDEAFFGQIGDWCERHGLAMTGHCMIEGDLIGQVAWSAGIMSHYVPMQLPGIDLLCERISEALTVKQCSSVCRQFARPRMLSETYGCTMYHFSFEGQKWIGDWQMALGVNLICQHLTHYTLKGLAKRDYPPSYYEQSPWWRHYRHVTDYQTRLCWALSQGEPVRDILLIHPLTSVFGTFDPPTIDAPAPLGEDQPENRRLNKVIEILLGLHRDFDFGDESILARHARVEGDTLIVGQAQYKAVVVPVVENLESTTLDLLERFRDAGGKVLWLFDRHLYDGERLTRPMPAYVDGRPSDRIRRFVEDPRTVRGSVHRQDVAERLDRMLPRRLSVRREETGVEAASVVCQERRDGDARVYFLAHTDREAGVRVIVRVPASGRWELWDAETGAIHPLPSRPCAGGSEVRLDLPPVGSALLRLDPTQPAVSAPAAQDVRRTEHSLAPASGAWPFQRLAPNSLILDRCRYALNDEPLSEPMLQLDAQNTWRKRLGLVPVQALNGDVQPWRVLKQPDALAPLARARLVFEFTVRVRPATETYLVIEDRDLHRILVNGALVEAPADGWFMDRAFQRVPVGKHLRHGVNTVEIATEINRVRPVEDIYLIGDFGVDAEDFALIAEPKTLRPGDWVRQGYPFYTDAMIYRASFDLEPGFAGRIEAAIEQFTGTAAAVHVNGARAGVIAWRPYRVDITSQVRPGRNEIGIEIVGSPRNLMGPRHTFAAYPVGINPIELSATTEPTYHLTPAGLFGDVKLVRTAR